MDGTRDLFKYGFALYEVVNIKQIFCEQCFKLRWHEQVSGGEFDGWQICIGCHLITQPNTLEAIPSFVLETPATTMAAYVDWRD